jgi:diaminopimelate epimerase
LLGQAVSLEASLQVAGHEYAVTCVSMGNPHAVIFMDKSEVDAFPLRELGPDFERHPAFPNRTNTELAAVVGPHEVLMRVYERGAGLTLACGTGSCAVVVAGVITGRVGRSQPCRVHLPGGDIEVFWDPANGHVFMSGDACLVFEGSCDVGADGAV